MLSALAHGDRVIATARSLDKVKDLPESNNLRLFRLDVTDSETAIQGVVADAVAVWGRIDVLVNNAGFGAPTILEEGGYVNVILQTMSCWKMETHDRTDMLMKHFNTNVFGLLKVTTAVLPHMRQRKSGTIVIIGSRSAWKTEIAVSIINSSNT